MLISVDFIQQESTIKVSFNEDDRINTLDVWFEDAYFSGGKVDPYTGNYTVIPDFQDQTLLTKNKLMEENVLVLEIPTYQTTNPSNGYTLYVGGL